MTGRRVRPGALTAALAMLAMLATLASAARADDDDSALMLADTLPQSVAPGSDWRIFGEATLGGEGRRDGGSDKHNHRLSLDLRYDRAFAADWRVVIADRLDASWPAHLDAQGAGQTAINTLKEAYLSWRVQPDTLLDVGRINVRSGVATGYNPTDFFRAGALRIVTSINPASLKEDRQGSVMARVQWLWDGGSLSALYSPKISDTPSTAAFNPNWGATNNQNRWLLSLSQKISDNLAPQVLLYQEAGHPAQLGLNLTALLNDSTVGFFEWSGGRGPSSLNQALRPLGIAGADDSAYRKRVSTGLTYTTSNKLSLTLEYEYNGAALDRADWLALSRSAPAAYWQYRQWLQVAQEPPTRTATFMYAAWQDALINHLDLNAMLRRNSSDGSRLAWLEARYHWDQSEVAMQWQLNSGAPGSEFGALPQQRVWQLLWRRYL